MPNRDRKLLRAFSWAVSLTSLFILTLGAVLISLIVGSWMMEKTGLPVLSWLSGAGILLGFLCTMGAGVGMWLWLRTYREPTPEDNADSLDKILAEMASADRE